MDDCWRKLKNNRYLFLRLALGSLFVVSGFEKLIGPYQNFLYVIQNYDLLPPFAEELTARIFPWIEFFLGIFLVLGLWLPWVLRGIMGMLLIFISVVGQALIRKLPVDECGCFGDLISFPLPVVLAFDSMLLILACWLYLRREETEKFGLDKYLSSHEEK